MSKITKTYSKQVAESYTHLGWTLQREFRVVADDDLYEYLLVWERVGDPMYPDIQGTRAPGCAVVRLACLEVVALTAALFVTVHGPVPDRLRQLSHGDRELLGQLLEHCRGLRDIAWSKADTETLPTRTEVIAARLRTFIDLQLDPRLLSLLGRVLDVCADEVDARGDIVSVTGFKEYGAGTDHFRALASRCSAWA